MQAIRISLSILLLFSGQLNSWAANIEVADVQCVCAQGQKGHIEMAITDAEGAYTVAWTGPAGFTSEEENLYELTIPGFYTMVYINSVGCGFEQEPVQLKQCLSVSRVNMMSIPICEENGSGAVLCQPLGLPVSELSFTWSNGATTQNLESVAAGTYSVTITDGENCAVVASATVVNAYDPLFGITLENNVGCICNSAPVAAFTLQLLGQNAPYTFAWEGADGFSSAEQNPLITQPGVYTVRVTDAYGCTYEAQTESCRSYRLTYPRQL